MINTEKPSRPEPEGFAHEVSKLTLEIVAVRPADESHFALEVRLWNGTSESVSPHDLAEWSRNVGWYAKKDEMADDGVDWGDGWERTLEPAESGTFEVVVISRSMLRGKRSPARFVSLEYLHEAEDGAVTHVVSNRLDVGGGTGVVPAAVVNAAPPSIGPKSGCLGIFFGKLG